MDCTDACERVLDDVDGGLEPAARGPLVAHLAGCEDCRSFAERQRQLDQALRGGAALPALSAAFRRQLERRIAARRAWPDWLPELAYLLGAGLATAATVVALPFPAASTWWIGGALAGLGLALHSLVAGALSEPDAAGC